MHDLALRSIVESARKRVAERAGSTEPLGGLELYENAIVELADRCGLSDWRAHIAAHSQVSDQPDAEISNGSVSGKPLY